MNSVHEHPDGLFDYMLTGPIKVANVKSTSKASKVGSPVAKPSYDLLDLKICDMLKKPSTLKKKQDDKSKSNSPEIKSKEKKKKGFEIELEVNEGEDDHPVIVLEEQTENATQNAAATVENLIDRLVELEEVQQKAEEKVAGDEDNAERKAARSLYKSTSSTRSSVSSDSSTNSTDYLDTLPGDTEKAMTPATNLPIPVVADAEEYHETLTKWDTTTSEADFDIDGLMTKDLLFYADYGQRYSILVNKNDGLKSNRLLINVRIGTTDDEKAIAETATFEKWSRTHSNLPLFTISPTTCLDGPMNSASLFSQQITANSVDIPWKATEKSKSFAITFNFVNSMLPCDISQKLCLIVDIFEQSTHNKVSSVEFAINLFWPGGALINSKTDELYCARYLVDQFKRCWDHLNVPLPLGYTSLYLPPSFWYLQLNSTPFSYILDSPSNYGSNTTPSTYLTRSAPYTLQMIPLNYDISTRRALLTTISISDPKLNNPKCKDFSNWSLVKQENALDFDCEAFNGCDEIRDVMRHSTSCITVRWVPMTRKPAKVVLKFNYTSVELSQHIEQGIGDEMFFSVNTFLEQYDSEPKEIDYASCLITVLEPGQPAFQYEADRVKYVEQSARRICIRRDSDKSYQPSLPKTTLFIGEEFYLKLVVFITVDAKCFSPVPLTKLEITDFVLASFKYIKSHRSSLHRQQQIADKVTPRTAVSEIYLGSLGLNGRRLWSNYPNDMGDLQNQPPVKLENKCLLKCTYNVITKAGKNVADIHLTSMINENTARKTEHGQCYDEMELIYEGTGSNQ